MSSWRLSLSVIVINLVPAAFLSQTCAQEVRWRESYSAAYQESVRTGRPLLMEFGTGACFWCQKLETTTLREPQIAKLINEKFIPVKVDARIDTELAAAVAVQSFPTLFILAPDRTILTRREGFGEVSEISEFLSDGLAKAPAPKADQIANNKSKRPAPFRVTGRDATDLLNEGTPSARAARAGRLMAQAKMDFTSGYFLAAMERSRALVNDYAKTPEAGEAQKLLDRIGGDPDRVRAMSADAGAGLADLYRKLADDADRSGKISTAEEYRQQADRIAAALAAEKK
jgi:thioredoxin-like negative regulator of GroEL